VSSESRELRTPAKANKLRNSSVFEIALREKEVVAGRETLLQRKKVLLILKAAQKKQTSKKLKG